MAYTLKFHDEFTGESSTVEIQNHTPTDLGTSWSVTSNNTNNPDVYNVDSTLIQAYHGGSYRQGCIANISGGWNETVDTVKQRGEWVPNQWGKVWPTLYLNESAGGNPQGYTAIWSLNYWRIIRYDDGQSSYTSVALGNLDTGGGTKHNLVMQLTCEPGSQELSVDGGTYTATGGTDETYDTGVPGSGGFKTQPSSGVAWVKFYEDAGATGPTEVTKTDTIAATDSVAVNRLLERGLLDSVAATDDVAANYYPSYAINNKVIQDLTSCDPTDSVSMQRLLSRYSIDDLAALDAVLSNRSLRKTISDDAAIIDNVSKIEQAAQNIVRRIRQVVLVDR